MAEDKAIEYISEDTEALWMQTVSDLNAAEAELLAINTKLKSWKNRFLDLLGVSSDTDVLKSMQKSIVDKVSALNAKLKELNTERERAERLRRIAEEEVAVAYSLQEKQKYATEYSSNPDQFLQWQVSNLELTKDIEELTQAEKESIYQSAESLTAIMDILVTSAEQNDIWHAWQVIAKARDIAFEDGKKYIQQVEAGKISRDDIQEQKLFINNKKYHAAAKSALSNILKRQPYFQGLWIIYNARGYNDKDNLSNYEKVDWYLDRIFSLVADDDESLRGLEHALTADVHDISTRHAKVMLKNISGFKKLPEQTRNELIESQALIYRADFDIAWLADASKRDAHISDINNALHALQVNVKRAIYENTTYDECVTQRLAIQRRIGDREIEIRNHWFKQQLTDRPYISIGLGLGMAWAVSAGLPTTVLMMGGAAILKAHFETNKINMRIPDVEEYAGLSTVLLPMAVDDLMQFDAFWGRGMQIPIEQTRVEIRSLHENVQGLFEATEARLLRNMLLPLAIFYSAQVLAATLVFIAAGMMLPIVWPIFAGLGVATIGAITYVAGKNLIDNIDIPDSKFYRAVSMVVAAIDFFIVTPAKYLFNKVKNWIFKPDASILEPEKFSLNFDLLPEAVEMLESMHPGLAKKLSDHFKQRAEDLKADIERVKVREANGEDINDALVNLNAEYRLLEKDWFGLVRDINNKGAFCITAAKYLDRMYERERKNFISIATETGQEVRRQSLIFGGEHKVKVGEITKNQDYYQELDRVQKLCDLKDVISRVKASL